MEEAVTQVAVTQEADVRPRPVRPWDPVVRLAHWGIAIAILVNGVVVEEGSAFHRWVGYCAAALLVLRLLWGVVGPSDARFSAFPPNPAAALRHLGGLFAGRDQPHRSHNPLGALMVYALWLTLAVVVGTGIAMADPPWVAREPAGAQASAPPTAAPAQLFAAGRYAPDADDRARQEEEPEDEQDGRRDAGSLSGAQGDEEAEPRESGNELLEEIHEASASLLMLLAAFHVMGVAVQSRLSGGRELRRILGAAPRDA
jgi:cytochrome b